MYLLCNGAGTGSATTASTSPGARQLGVYEGKCSLSILGAVAIVRACIIAITAVRVGCVTVGLNFRRAWAREARWTGIKLKIAN
jgi:hypothetical protein